MIIERRQIEDREIKSIYFQETDTLVINLNPESRDGLILWCGPNERREK